MTQINTLLIITYTNFEITLSAIVQQFKCLTQKNIASYRVKIYFFKKFAFNFQLG